MEKPLWTKGDVWHIRANVMRHRDSVVRESSDQVTLRFEVVDDETVYGEECRVLKITSTDSLQAVYPGLKLELFAYYSVRDGALKRVRTRRWENGKLAESDRHSPPGKPLLSFQLTLSFRIPLDVPPFPIKEDSPPHELVRYDVRAKANDGTNSDVDKVVESSIITTAAVKADSGGQGQPGQQTRAPAFDVKFLTRSLYSKSGQRDKVHVEETWERGKKWWTSATNKECQIVGKWSLVED